jgi:hypothetical protein
MRERKRRKTWSGGDSGEGQTIFPSCHSDIITIVPVILPLGQLRGKKAFINLFFILSLLPLQAIEQRVQVVA